MSIIKKETWNEIKEGLWFSFKALAYGTIVMTAIVGAAYVFFSCCY